MIQHHTLLYSVVSCINVWIFIRLERSLWQHCIGMCDIFKRGLAAWFKAGNKIFLVLIFKEMEIDIIVVQMRKILTVLSMALLKSWCPLSGDQANRPCPSFSSSTSHWSRLPPPPSHWSAALTKSHSVKERRAVVVVFKEAKRQVCLCWEEEPCQSGRHQRLKNKWGTGVRTWPVWCLVAAVLW